MSKLNKIEITKENAEYIKGVTTDLAESELKNNGIFGDEEYLRKIQAINNLQNWERNLIILYIKYGSLRKLSSYLGISTNALQSAIKKIKTKCNTNY